MKNHFETIRAEEALKQKTLEKAKKGKPFGFYVCAF